VVSRARRVVSLGAALALCALCGCADLWNFKNFETSTGDESPDATTGTLRDAGSDARAPVEDVAILDALPSMDACTVCSGQCLDLTSDHGNCGKCGNACLASQTCQDGVCMCPGGLALCGSGPNAACVDTTSDQANCYKCGNACPSGSVCQNSTCTCPGGKAEELCGSAPNQICVYTISDHNNCSSCGTTCAIGGTCQASACTCPAGQIQCTGDAGPSSCADLTTDRANCGGCNNQCQPTQSCLNSACVLCANITPAGAGIMCGTPLVCVDQQTDRNNCGGCGNKCLSSEVCLGGMCICPTGETLCGSGANQGCVTLSSDQNNCGKCGTACTGGQVCSNSKCVCPTSYHLCGSTCIPDNNESISSCGTTCAACPPPNGGTPTCSGTPPKCGQTCNGQTLCGSSCVNTSTDPSNCSRCGNVCAGSHAVEGCISSQCAVTACLTGFRDCDGVASNGCETSINTDVNNCGSCGHACNMIGGTETCVNGQCSEPVCNAPMANCDGNAANGCEINTSDDKNNCGSCGHVCPTGANCSGSQCTNCAAGTMLCNNACAPCPTSPANGTLACAGGSCVATCNNGNLPKLCGSGNNTVCVNTQTDNGNCGNCGMTCSTATAPDKCDQTYNCQAGSCVGSNPVTCPPASDSCHVAGSCNTSSGTCSPQTNAQNGTMCSGNNKCDSFACQNGTCTGTNMVTCTATDVCHVAGTCSAGTGTCSPQTNAHNGTTCTGTNKCDTYACAAGVCNGTPSVACPPSDGCHVAGTCDPSTGLCSNPNAPDGTPCNGSNMCLTYTCSSGVCTGSNPGTCAPTDQCHVAGTCNPVSGMCMPQAAPNGTMCNDGNACTQNDTCQNGSCVGGNPVVCMASDACHVIGTCDPNTGTCSNPPGNQGATCDGDGTCNGGMCKCPMGQTLQGGMCTCPAGQMVQGGMCVCPGGQKKCPPRSASTP
jgi:hypothetical protein